MRQQIVSAQAAPAKFLYSVMRGCSGCSGFWRTAKLDIRRLQISPAGISVTIVIAFLCKPGQLFIAITWSTD